MRAYADSSFLLSLYIPDRNAEKALALLPSLQKPLSPLTPFHRLELRNGLARKQFQNQLSAKEVAAVWANIETDSTIFAGGRAIDWLLVMEEAERLSVSHTPVHGTRSLDVIHIAIALHFGVQDFISFDHRQRSLAVAMGLNVLPADKEATADAQSPSPPSLETEASDLQRIS